MNVADVFDMIMTVAKAESVSQPYIVGGLPRGVVAGDEHFNDIDITTGDDDIFVLARAVAKELDHKLKHLNSGGYRVMVGDVCLDFSSNYYYENIDVMLDEMGIDKTPLTRETLSRDFTINTLLIPVNRLDQIIDMTGMGIEDINNKILRCPLDMDLCFKSVPSRMLRALHLHVCKGYGITDDMLASISINANLLKTIDGHYAGHLLNEIVAAQPNFLEILIELDILPYLPITKKVLRQLVESRGLIKIL